MRTIKTKGYTVYHGDVDVPFKKVALRKIANLVRNVKPIPGYRSICDIENDSVFAIVSEDYKLVQHQEVIDAVNAIVAQHPEWGTPERTVYVSPDGARKKAVWRFPDIQYEIRPGDFVNPTIEAYSSFDTSLAQVITLGGFRLVCSNGMYVGKILAEYKRKHTASLELDVAIATISAGMESYSNVASLWSSYAERMAIETEFTLFEELPFHKEEKEHILTNMRSSGDVKVWDIKDGKKERNVTINAWELMNIYTYEATHNVSDVTRQVRILEGISKGFKR